jgi:Fe-S oxidoreductase
MDPVKLVNQLMGSENDGYRIEKNDRCCGESGTLTVKCPNISTQVRFRKVEEFKKATGRFRREKFGGNVKVLTTCPACLQGLSRYAEDADMSSDYIVVEMARKILGEE